MKIDVYMKPRLTGIGAARNRLQNTNPYTDALRYAAGDTEITHFSDPRH